jgi:alanyl-tRNA synthetase
VPFKDVFSGVEKRNYTRAASCQRCIRAGGKHNDLENVGYTARHHTFFEMLGNFSFGDYFKEDAIKYAWEFLTVELKLPKEKLWVSVYEDDDEAEQIWVEIIGFPKNRISRCGAKDNFWQMGDTGPCGPSSEIFYDHGAHIAGGPPGTADEDGDRFIEIWNLVFTQFDKQEDGYLKPLSKPCVDTGMGLERIAAIMQDRHNNYDIDTFAELCKKITTFTPSVNKIKVDNPSVRVIADHIRSTAFLISDGVMPANEGRGYVLRRIMRRALRHGYKLGIDNSFFYLLSSIVAYQNKNTYPEVQQNLALIEKTIKNEEERFAKTLDSGMNILEQAISKMKSNILSGDIVFKLYDTYGFPYDLTADIARERNLILDEKGFNQAMAEQKNRARAASDFKVSSDILIESTTDFIGYDNDEFNAAIVSIISDNQEVNEVGGGEAIIVLDKTPFYAESGGQIGDIGEIVANGNTFIVIDTQKQKTGSYLHIGKVNGNFKVGDNVVARIDNKNRDNIRRNHSATHLLHAALKQILGENVSQKGSLVESDKLRFDFSYDTAIKDNELFEIEKIVNNKILENTKTHTEVMSLDQAKKIGAMALFGEKYDDEVRVLTMGSDNFSVELCGGTHIARLGDIGAFRIISESSIASGVRRIEALTGEKAYEFDALNKQNIANLATILKSNDVVAKVNSILDNQKQLAKQIENLQKKLGSSIADDLIANAKEIDGVKVLSTKVAGVEAKDLRDLVDKLKAKLKSAIVVLAVVKDEKISLVAGVSKDLTDKYNAGQILNKVATQIGGKGGGRPDMAQGGGSDIAKLANALQSVYDLE